MIKYVKYILCFKKLFSTFGFVFSTSISFWLAGSYMNRREPLSLFRYKKTTYFVLQKRACAAARATRPVKRSSESARHKISTRQDLECGVKILVKNEFDCEIYPSAAQGLLLLRVSLIM